jgi:hypothetical protein
MKKRNVWVVYQDEQGNTWKATRPIVFRPGRNERERVSKSASLQLAIDRVMQGFMQPGHFQKMPAEL